MIKRNSRIESVVDRIMKIYWGINYFEPDMSSKLTHRYREFISGSIVDVRLLDKYCRVGIVGKNRPVFIAEVAAIACIINIRPPSQFCHELYILIDIAHTRHQH